MASSSGGRSPRLSSLGFQTRLKPDTCAAGSAWHTARWELVLFNPVGWPFTGLAEDSRERQAKVTIGQFPKRNKTTDGHKGRHSDDS